VTGHTIIGWLLIALGVSTLVGMLMGKWIKSRTKTPYSYTYNAKYSPRIEMRCPYCGQPILATLDRVVVLNGGMHGELVLDCPVCRRTIDLTITPEHAAHLIAIANQHKESNP
jgi:Cysteine-rich CPXCG